MASGCKSFPVVETRFLNWDNQAAVEMICAKRDPNGQAWEVDESLCAEFYNCTICNQDGECKRVPFSECDKTVGYSPNDHERILKWGRANCGR